MIQSMNMQHAGLLDLTEEDLLLTNGGQVLTIPSWLRKVSALGVFAMINDNWDEIKKEFTAGWNIDKK